MRLRFWIYRRNESLGLNFGVGLCVYILDQGVTNFHASLSSL